MSKEIHPFFSLVQRQTVPKRKSLTLEKPNKKKQKQQSLLEKVCDNLRNKDYVVIDRQALTDRAKKELIKYIEQATITAVISAESCTLETMIEYYGRLQKSFNTVLGCCIEKVASLNANIHHVGKGVQCNGKSMKIKAVDMVKRTVNNTFQTVDLKSSTNSVTGTFDSVLNSMVQENHSQNIECFRAVAFWKRDEKDNKTLRNKTMTPQIFWEDFAQMDYIQMRTIWNQRFLILEKKAVEMCKHQTLKYQHFIERMVE